MLVNFSITWLNLIYNMENNNLDAKLNSFLNKMIPIKYPEVNHIVVRGKKNSDGNFEYNISVNPTFDGIYKLKNNPKFPKELFEYIYDTSDFAFKMFKSNNVGHYINNVTWFWD
jgi:hypothetical protein